MYAHYIPQLMVNPQAFVTTTTTAAPTTTTTGAPTTTTTAAPGAWNFLTAQVFDDKDEGLTYDTLNHNMKNETFG